MKHKKGRKLSATYSIRLGDLAEPLVVEAEKEEVDPSKIIHRAVRNYLKDSKNPDRETYESLLDSLNFFRQDFARVGGNLNQLARCFNVENDVNLDKLKESHNELRDQFRKLGTLLNTISKEMKY